MSIFFQLCKKLKRIDWQDSSFVKEACTYHFSCIQSVDQLILFMFLVWLDLRTQSTVERLLKRIPGKNKTFFKVKDIPEYLKS